ncbi:hypothetical protein BH09PLA1_BH09PLA1_03510 [soil metagenome]
MPDIGVILLAAGGSTRMGTPKQFLQYEGRSLLRRAVDAATQSECTPVIVVLNQEVKSAAGKLSATAEAMIEVNPNGKRGIGTSIVAGLGRLRKEQPEISGAVITLCDQPHVGAGHLTALCAAHRATGRGVVATAFGSTLGSPCLFASHWFDRLMALGDAEGAKRLILSAGDDLATVSLPEAAVDVDTPQDYEGLTGI